VLFAPPDSARERLLPLRSGAWHRPPHGRKTQGEIRPTGAPSVIPRKFRSSPRRGPRRSGRPCLPERLRRRLVAQEWQGRADRKADHQAPFPPEGTRSPLPEATPGRRRAFGFLLNQVRRTTEPDIPLKEVLADWKVIFHDLAEPKRKRRSRWNRTFPTP